MDNCRHVDQEKNLTGSCTYVCLGGERGARGGLCPQGPGVTGPRGRGVGTQADTAAVVGWFRPFWAGQLSLVATHVKTAGLFSRSA